MTLSVQFAITFISALLLSAVVTWFVRKAMIHFKVLDQPDQERKIHDKPIPLGGGIAIYLAVLGVMVVLYSLGWLTDDRISGSLLIALGIAGAVITFGGILDDRNRLSWWMQLIFPLIAVAILLGAGLEVGFVTNPFGEGLLYLNKWRITLFSSDSLTLTFSPIADIFLFIWIIGMMYTTKLLDGVDGLTTSIGSIAAMVIFVVSMSWDQTGSITSFLAVSLAGAGVGFLFWNWHPAKIFLGEGGSLYLGFMLAVLAVISGGKIATALLVMGIPILDVVWIILRRLKTHSKLYMGDSKHLHFRLLHAGLSQRQVVIFLSFLSLLFGSVSFFFSTKGKLVALVLLMVVMILIARFVVQRHENKTIPH